MPVRSLKETASLLLERVFHKVEDLGDCDVSLVQQHLYLTSAPQLALLEERTEALRTLTNDIWRAHAVRDLNKSRRGIESMASPTPERTWRAFYWAEAARQQAKMGELLARMRNKYRDHEDEKRRIVVDKSLRPPKRRKIAASQPRKPKSIMEKARIETRKVQLRYTSSAPAGQSRPLLATDSAPPPAASSLPRPSIPVTIKPTRDKRSRDEEVEPPPRKAPPPTPPPNRPRSTNAIFMPAKRRA